jgi:hypothetical protein
MAGTSSASVDSAVAATEWVCTIAVAPVAAYTARCNGISLVGRSGASAAESGLPSSRCTPTRPAVSSA